MSLTFVLVLCVTAPHCFHFTCYVVPGLFFIFILNERLAVKVYQMLHLWPAFMNVLRVYCWSKV